jgi:polysaccharide biosynthesis protein PelA
MIVFLQKIGCIVLFLCCYIPATVQAVNPSIAFYYGAKPPLADLQAFDIVVVEPGHVTDPAGHARAAKDGTHELFAYVSLGEVQPDRPYYKTLPKGSLRSDNAAWGSKVIDQTAPGWQEFFLSNIIEPLWQQGWRGFFLDTLDSYQLFAKTDIERQAQMQAMVAIVREFKRRYPQARLILNRGFELLPEIAPLTFAVAAESLYQGFDAARKQYRPVPEKDREWLLGQMKTVQDVYHLPVIAIDYVDPAQPGARELARRTATQIRRHGFVPWVADGALASIGVGNIEVIPRTVLIVVDTTSGSDLHYTEAQRFLGVHLNYLGLRYEFVDIAREALPEGTMSGHYAGIVTWFRTGTNRPALASWLKRRINEGMRIAIFDAFGFNVDAAAATMFGLQLSSAERAEKLTIQSSDKNFIGFELEPLPDRNQLVPLRLRDDRSGRSLLRLADTRGNRYDAAAITSWGGYVVSPFTVVDLPMQQDQARWIVQPLLFLKAAFNLPDVPVPDVTTEGGRRILLNHIDGDGFASRAEQPGAPFVGEVVLNILERYRIPVTVSVIEGEISAQGIYKDLAVPLESIARRIFALPFVEGASHAYSHPFFWVDSVNGAQNKPAEKGMPEKVYSLPLPGYTFNLQREIQGSIDYINTRLMPAGKRASVFLWTGDCVPPAIAIAQTYRDGLLNMNGGDTVITESQKTWTAIAAQGVRKDGWYQVFAPNQNENVYTNNWHGPFYGFERVIETYKLTETPFRFKPVDIYYHMYSASKPGSLAALHKIYRWTQTQAFTPVYGSQYIRKVLDFERTSIARDLESGDLVVRTGADLRTLRLPPDGSLPSLSDSDGLAGFAPGPSAQYLTLAASQVRLSNVVEASRPAYVYQATGSISQLSRTVSATGRELRFTLTAHGQAAFSLAQSNACSVSVDGKLMVSSTSNSVVTSGSTVRPAAFAVPEIKVQQYEIGASNNLFTTSRHMVFVRCPV